VIESPPATDAPTPVRDPEGAAAARREPALGSGPAAPRAGSVSVEALARSGLSGLRERGVDGEVVRSRDGCLVVRSTARPPVPATVACSLVRDWLEELPTIALGVGGHVVESACEARGGRSCIHTLIWAPDAGNGLPANGSANGNGLPANEVPADGNGLAPAVLPADGHGTADTLSGAVALPTPATSDEPPLGTLLVPPHATATTVPDALPPRPADPPVQPVQPVQPAAPAERVARVAWLERPPAPRLVVGGPETRLHSLVRRTRWLCRRAVLLALGVLAGTLGGTYASVHGSAAYVGTATVVVQSPSATGASTANGAQALAVTYAALIPEDQALLRRVAGRLATAEAAVAHALSVEAVSGTALIEVRFSAPTSHAARRGANAVARVLASPVPPGTAIGAGTVSLVSSARTAAQSGSLRKYGLPLGGLLGLLVGVGAATVAERVDRRVDEIESLGAAAGCSATREPGGISPGEMAHALAGAVSAVGAASVAVVPLRARQSETAGVIAAALSAAWSHGAADGRGIVPVEEHPPFEWSPSIFRRSGGPSVLVVAEGERVAAVEEASERLRLIGRGPVWSVLVPAGEAKLAHGRGV